MLWSLTSFLCEVPSGALADTVSRRLLLQLSAVLYLGCFGSWLLLPSYGGFLLGFVLWGVSSSLMSGTFEALLYDELASAGQESSYDMVRTRAETAGVASISFGMLAAGPLVALGGYRAVAIASLAVAAVHLATTAVLPAPPRREAVAERRYLQHLRTGVSEVARTPALRRTVLAITATVALVGFDEYFALFFADAGLTPGWVAVAVAVVAVAQGLGTWAASRRTLPGRRAVAQLTVLAGAAFAAGAVAALAHAASAALAAVVLIAVAYGIITNLYVAQENRLQHQITGSARATVTSVAGVSAELGAITSFALMGGLAHWWSVPFVLLVATMPFTAIATAVVRKGRPRSRRPSARTAGSPGR
ncbi:MFS transporter [Flexivirga endophytica]|uniref:MFS transporter n=1 Tax=Flexivirga endophytica TaxID=1849103 RepID=A0A916WRQ5_9MICO|nr:MFS transporter [Flexivirga endophytica]GHB54961.1 MFS transporter [Flexivirga endophytica]